MLKRKLLKNVLTMTRKGQSFILNMLGDSLELIY